MRALQWGGRFTADPDVELLAFGSSINEDLLLAPFDVACSLAHVEALRGGGIVDENDAKALIAALDRVHGEIQSGTFAAFARESGAEDIHGAIDARVRELAGSAGERLHGGRSRNDQVATTLLLFVRDRARAGTMRSLALAELLARRARAELRAGTLVAGCTHRQPAQPVMLAFVLIAWAEPFLRSARRFVGVARDAARSSPLGSAALAGSGLPLDRERSARALGFEAASRNALDAIGNRDCALDLAHACVRASIDASRIAEELIAWSTPAYGYVVLGDAASTGSSLLPQKRNPDPFELVRAHAAKLLGGYAGALATLCGLAPSYQRDLQETKAVTIAIAEDALGTLAAFERAWSAVTFSRERMNTTALDGYTVATDIADALVARGVPSRRAHALVGGVVRGAESERRRLDAGDLAEVAARAGLETLQAPLAACDSVAAKRTRGSTAPTAVAEQLDSLEAELEALRSTTL